MNGPKSGFFSGVCTLPTIWDQLSPIPNKQGIPTGGYFFRDLPFLALWGTKYFPFWHPFAAGDTDAVGIPVTTPSFIDTVAQGNLPNVSFVDPAFDTESNGTSADDHPLAEGAAADDEDVLERVAAIEEESRSFTARYIEDVIAMLRANGLGRRSGQLERLQLTPVYVFSLLTFLLVTVAVIAVLLTRGMRGLLQSARGRI